jgi:predicted nucleic acid-binding OB-fold protein
MSGHLSPEDGKALLNLCRAGRLYAVEEWIASGKSIRTPPQIKKTPLQVAMELGFHSLIELLIRHEERLEVKNEALAKAVERKRFDVVELIVSYGADIRSVPLSDVLLTWEPRMMAFFWTAGPTLSRTHRLPLLSARKSGQRSALMSSTRRRTRNWRRVFRSKLTAPSDISAMKEI